MRLIDDLRDRSRGNFRVETGPYTAKERRKMRLGIPTFFVGLTVMALTQSYAYTFFAMVVTADLVLSILPDETD